MTTPGQQAMREAARIEAARIYSRLIGEHQAMTNTPRDLTAEIAYWSRKGQSAASIAFRLGTTKRAVAATLERLGAA